jgi:DNA-binding response OmpR family regulator
MTKSAPLAAAIARALRGAAAQKLEPDGPQIRTIRGIGYLLEMG